MIQRIQSLYLAAIEILGILGVASYFLQSDTTKYHLTFSVFSGIIALLQMPIIILFKNRKLQMQLCKVVIALILSLIGFSVVFINELDLGIILYIPIVQLILIILALHAIKKDEELVRSVDRIR